MDSNRFDRLARSIGVGPTRRVVLAALTATIPAGLPFLGADAKKKGKGKGKKKKKKTCKPACGACQTCVNKTCTVQADGASCPDGECLDGSCCQEPARVCGDTCCPSANFCCLGACCAAGESCDLIAGECVAGGSCGSGQHACDDLPGNPACCLNTQTCCQNGQCCGSGAECCHEAGTENYYCSSFGCVL